MQLDIEIGGEVLTAIPAMCKIEYIIRSEIKPSAVRILKIITLVAADLYARRSLAETLRLW